ncbi:UNC93-like protein MFSD11 [Aphelenchoides besseyi]|nr:UNC93-like protein MFSD11 [Aphelenchoides besseyi]
MLRCCPRTIRRLFITMNHHTFNVLQLATGAGFIEETVIATLSGEQKIGKHAGYNSLAIVYAFFTFSNFLAAPVVHKLGARWSLVIGGVGYGLFQVGFLFLNEPYLYFSSAVLGFCAAIIWTAQGKYLSLNSDENTASKHSGLFWGISQACLSCGGIFLFFVFNSGSDTITDFTIHIIYGVFTSVTVVGIIILSLLRMPNVCDDNTETAPTLPSPSTVPEMSQMELLKSTIRLCASKRMLLLIVAFMYTGIELSFWSGIYPASIGFTKRLGSNTKSLVGLNAITQGLGQATGGFLFGILSSKTAAIGRDRIVMLGALINILGFVGVYVNFPNDAPLHETQGTGLIEPQIAVALVCGYLLGFGDACWNTQIYSQLITNYNKQSAQAFSLFKFFQSLLTCAAFWYGSVFDLHIQLIMLTAGAILGCFCFTLAERLPISSSENETSDVHVD